MTEREQVGLLDKREYLYVRARGRCEVCGKVLDNTWQIAHRIPQRKRYVKMVGKVVIHHHLNLAAVCGLKCNSAVSLYNKPLQRDNLLREIYLDLGDCYYEA